MADNWTSLATAGNYAFNDMHAMMAFASAGRTKAAEAVIEMQRCAMESDGDNAIFTREVGHAATRAIKAFGDGDYAGTVRLLRAIRRIAHPFGGSHAQRGQAEEPVRPIAPPLLPRQPEAMRRVEPAH